VKERTEEEIEDLHGNLILNNKKVKKEEYQGKRASICVF